MPENRKYFPHGGVILATARTEEGLPFVCSLVINFFIWGILARARTLYDIKVCHFIFMGNHFHMLLVVNNPAHVQEFIGYVKAETAHVVNRLLGRRRRTIWQEGYDSPLVLDTEKTIHYIKYIYANPARAHLVDSIKEYPGVSSWEMYTTNSLTKRCHKPKRSQIFSLHHPAQSISEQKRTLTSYLKLKTPLYTFVLEPNAWMKAFPETKGREEEIHNQILEEIETEEHQLAEVRKSEHKRSIGSTALRRESIAKAYTPTTFGKKMICVSTEVELRKHFINHFRELSAQARYAYEQWRTGDLSYRIPPGLLSPPLPSLVSAILIT